MNRTSITFKGAFPCFILSASIAWSAEKRSEMIEGTSRLHPYLLFHVPQDTTSTLSYESNRGSRVKKTQSAVPQPGDIKKGHLESLVDSIIRSSKAQAAASQQASPKKGTLESLIDSIIDSSNSKSRVTSKTVSTKSSSLSDPQLFFLKKNTRESFVVSSVSPTKSKKKQKRLPAKSPSLSSNEDKSHRINNLEEVKVQQELNLYTPQSSSAPERKRYKKRSASDFPSLSVENTRSSVDWSAIFKEDQEIDEARSHIHFSKQKPSPHDIMMSLDEQQQMRTIKHFNKHLERINAWYAVNEINESAITNPHVEVEAFLYDAFSAWICESQLYNKDHVTNEDVQLLDVQLHEILSHLYSYRGEY